MKYIDLQKQLNKLKVFSIEDLKILDDKFNKSKISNWIKVWHIKSIIRWYYLTSEVQINQNLLYQVSNKIYFPSYISLESAFNYYWIIPEQTFSITAVVTKKTIDYNTQIWHFSYRKIKPSLYWWYNLVKMQENIFLIAELEKAILDYLYLNHQISNEDDFELLRWNKNLLNEKMDFDKLDKYTKLYQSPVITKKINKLLTYLKNDSNSIY